MFLQQRPQLVGGEHRLADGDVLQDTRGQLLRFRLAVENGLCLIDGWQLLPVVRGETDLCVGSRFAGGSDELSVGFGQLIRSNGNILMNIAINKRWNISLTDTLNGFRAIRRQAALSRPHRAAEDGSALYREPALLGSRWLCRDNWGPHIVASLDVATG